MIKQAPLGKLVTYLTYKRLKAQNGVDFTRTSGWTPGQTNDAAVEQVETVPLDYSSLQSLTMKMPPPANDLS
jgi:hypothetical protein